MRGMAKWVIGANSRGNYHSIKWVPDQCLTSKHFLFTETIGDGVSRKERVDGVF